MTLGFVFEGFARGGVANGKYNTLLDLICKCFIFANI